ncbi:MAG: cupin domain-containing protein [Caldilineaceae bacterium]|nr:cupin domain-containing protein [Caldilineaceae bacterium]
MSAQATPQGQALPSAHFANTREQATFSAAGPQPRFLLDSEQGAVVVAGLEAGQQIPAHPEGTAIYHFLEGSGTMLVDAERYAVAAGSTVIVPAGAHRGMQAATRLVFLAVKFAGSPTAASQA